MPKPRLTVFAGANGSGKTTLYKRHAHKFDNPYINADEIASNERVFEIRAAHLALTQRKSLILAEHSFVTETTLSGNSPLKHKLWNRLSSGSYFPKPVKAVTLPKSDGTDRVLGVPTVADRIAQTVAVMVLEPELEQVFHTDFHGYRPGRSAHQALSVTRKRCWDYDWVLEYDIRGLFDNIDHDLLFKALRRHTDEKWVLLYVERWLVVPMQREDGELQSRDRGMPQGGVCYSFSSGIIVQR